MKKVKKAEVGTRLKSRQYKRLGRIAEKNPERAEEVAGRMKLRATRTQRGKEIAGDDPGARVRKAMEEAKAAPKAKEGKSFPDLNKDGKITKADILKGRGVIKNGGKVKKAQSGTVLKTKVSKALKDHNMFKESYNEAKAKSRLNERDILPNAKPESSRLTKKDTLPASKPGASKKTLMKKGGKIKKAQAGLTASNKRVGPIDPKGAWTKVQEQTLAGKKTPVSLKKDKQLGATKMMKSGGKIKKKK